MREEAGRLFPERRQGVPLAVLWSLCAFVLCAFCGPTVRTGCGTLFTAALIWLAFLDVRDGFLYDCITLPFALLGAALSAAGFLAPFAEALIGGTLRRLILLPAYCLAWRDGRRRCQTRGRAWTLAGLAGGGYRRLDRLYAGRHYGCRAAPHETAETA